MRRLDSLVAELFNFSRSFSSKLIKEGYVRINNSTERNTSKKISEEDQKTISINPDWINNRDDPAFVKPQNIPLNVIYEDDFVLVINKDPGISVHTSSSERENTILNALLYRFNKSASEVNLLDRPGIVHRLDKDTSGVLIIAKDLKTQDFLSSQFKNRETIKEYFAIVEGFITDDIVIEKPIARNKINRKKMSIDEGGRYSLTEVHPVERYFKSKSDKYTFLSIKPKTGRTHQIRIHLKSLGHAIVGDKIYNGKINNRMLLHAGSLTITIPKRGIMTFTAPLPDYFDDFRSNLNKV